MPSRYVDFHGVTKARWYEGRAWEQSMVSEEDLMQKCKSQIKNTPAEVGRALARVTYKLARPPFHYDFIFAEPYFPWSLELGFNEDMRTKIVAEFISFIFLWKFGPVGELELPLETGDAPNGLMAYIVGLAVHFNLILCLSLCLTSRIYYLYIYI